MVRQESVSDYKLKVGLLWAIVMAPFLGGYFYFLNFEIAGINVDVFQLVLGVSTCVCIIKLIQKKWGMSDLKGICGALSLFLMIMLAVNILNGVKDGFTSGGALEIKSIMNVLIYLFCIIVITADDIKLWEKLQNIMIVTGGIVAILSYAEVLIGFCMPASRYNEMEYLSGYSVHPATSIYTNENNLAAFFLIVSTVLIFKIIKEQEWKRLCLLYIEYIAILILVTLSDSTIFKMGVFIVFIVAAFFSIKRNLRNKHMYIRLGTIAGIMFMILIIFKSFFRKGLMFLNILINHGWEVAVNVDIDRKLAEGDTMMNQLLNSGMGTVTIRKNLFFYGMEAAKEKPWIGHGADKFNMLISSNKEWLKNTGGISDPHNLIVEIATQYGMIVLLMFLMLCLIIFLISLKHSWTASDTIDTNYILILLMIIAFAITTVMPSSFIKYPVYYIPLIIVARGIDILKKVRS